jgi:nitroreductase
MSNPVLDTIASRRSIRGYKADQITKEELDALLAAAVQSPSANNAQPWHFSVVQDQAIFDEINKESAKNFGQDLGDIFYGAPTAIFISADPKSRWGRLDSGIAVENIAIAAESLGLGSVILGLPEAAFAGPNQAHFDALLKFPAKHSFAVAIAVGYPVTTKGPHAVEPDRITFV